MRVIELLVLTQGVEQVSFVPDEDAVEEFVAAALDPAFHDRVHPRDPDSAENDCDTRIGEYGIEQGGELSVAHG